MQKKKLKGPSATVIRADEDAYFALKNIAGYKPSNPEFSVEAATAAYEARQRQREVVALAINALSAARDSLAILDNDLHDVMNGAKNQIRAIYGEDSDELASMGLKKKSEKRYGIRKTKKKEEVITG
ncbi:hypothetical protein [Zoogloea sp. 1C4]|uniref:hypothetical protein n=1 Tax=Zoogloea sp. 1C4 TaxID=2570190 RepID=UPI001291061C|nr:hypothetical protein [Zoogloea sp. 1C4]